MAFPKMVDLELDDEDKLDGAVAYAGNAGMEKAVPDYPWGLRFSLTEKELAKLGLHCEDCEVGDYVHIMAFARVKNKSSSEGEHAEGKNERVELQIEKMAIEDEDREAEADDERDEGESE